MTVKVFVLTQRIFIILRGKGLIHCCRECGKSFKVGDVIISKEGGGSRAKWYCREHAIKFKLI